MSDRGKGKEKRSGSKQPHAQTEQILSTSPAATSSSPAGISSPTPHLTPPASVTGGRKTMLSLHLGQAPLMIPQIARQVVGRKFCMLMELHM